MLKSIKNDLLYILNILEAIEKILIYAKDCKNAEDFYYKNDQLNFNATLTLFTQIAENVGKLSDELKNIYFPIEWHKIKGLRNRITHDYTGIDIFIVFDIIQNSLSNLESELIKIIQNELC